MSDAQANPSPALTDTVLEVQGHFPSDDALQAAIGALTLAGFDRAEFSLPHDRAGQSIQTPTEGADNPIDEIDKTQIRTMSTSMAAYAGAALAAGATLATGGAAAVAVAAAAAVGTGAALTTSAANTGVTNADHENREDRARAGNLILGVRLRSQDQFDTVRTILTQNGATAVDPVTRGTDLLTAGVSAASWTGG